MEKAITTSLLVIAGIVATLALINAVIPAVGKSSGALLTANSDAADRIKTDVDIVFASGNSTGDVITFWAKNVGSASINPIGKSDIFLTTPSTISRIDYTGDVTSNPSWTFDIEGGGSAWIQSVTVKFTLTLASGTTGLHTVKLAVFNGVSTEKEFSN